ncbi:MAG: hypothetical protein PHF67_00110 [Candidatus Nanoarchaeia archaeon]|nr:hypothetical protein [Candidatus Nanoarchaeia archaeon]
MRTEVIIPINLLFGLLRSHLLRLEKKFDQESSLCGYDSAYEFQISTRLNTLLNGGRTNGSRLVKPVGTIEELLGEDYDPELYRFLGLEHLTIKRFRPPSLICRPMGIYRNFPVKGFDITKVEMTEEGQRKFLNNLNLAHDWLFQTKLGLGELEDTSFDPATFEQPEF